MSVECQQIFERHPMGMLLVEVSSGKILRSNPAACLFLGRDEGQLLNTPWSSLLAKSAGVVSQMLDGVMLGLAYNAKDNGGKVYFDTSFTLLPAKDPAKSAVMLAVLTPCAAREAQSRARADEAKLQALGQLAGGLAHDYNNLLAIIAGNLEIMKREGMQGLVDECLITVDRAQGLSRQILRYARQASPEMGAVPLVELVRRIGQLTGVDQIKQDSMVAESDCVWADSSELEAALINLLTNARDVVKNEKDVRMGVEALRLMDEKTFMKGKLSAGDYRVIVVSDKGPGIPKENLGRIFEPYFTTKTHKGMGLGLARVWATVDSMQGAIELQTAPGKGTTWRVILPLIESKKPSLLPSSTPLATGGRLWQTSEIMVVDDEPSLVRMVQRLLGYEGFRSRGYTQPEVAFEELKSMEEPFVLITDARMPGMTGVSLVKALRSAHSRFVALLMSGYSEEIAGPSDRALFDSRLEKPVGAQVLIEAIKTAQSHLSHLG